MIKFMKIATSITLVLLWTSFAPASSSTSIQPLIELIRTNPSQAEKSLESNDRPLAKAWLAYSIFTNHKKSAAREAQLKDIRANIENALQKYEMYFDDEHEITTLEVVLNYLFIAYLEDSGTETVPNWLFQRHPIEAIDASWAGTAGGYSSCFVIEKLEPIPDDMAIGNTPEFIDFTTYLSEIAGDTYTCNGSIRYAISSSRLRWKHLINASPSAASTYHSPPAQRITQIEHYISTKWANEGIWNKRKAQEYALLKQKASNALEKMLTNSQHNIKDVPKIVQQILDSTISMYLHFSENTLADIKTKKYVMASTANKLATGQTSSFENLNKQELDHALKLCILTRQPIPIIDFLVAKGADLDTGEEGAAILAVDDPKYLSHVIELGASVDYENCFGKTALGYACQFGNLDSVKILIANGSNINKTTHLGRTNMPDEIPIETHCTDTSNFCLMNYWNPLKYAISQGTPEIVEYLLNSGADASFLQSKDELLSLLAMNKNISETQKKSIVDMFNMRVPFSNL